MDQELIAYLDERFHEVGERFHEVDERFRETNQQIADLRNDMNRQFVRMEGTIREARIEIEGMRDDVKQVAEGVVGLDERLRPFRTDISDLDRRVRDLELWRSAGRDPIALIRKRFGMEER
jgi:chromosome segregation ATPase